MRAAAPSDSRAHSPQLEKAHMQRQKPSSAKNKYINEKINKKHAIKKEREREIGKRKKKANDYLLDKWMNKILFLFS